MAPTIEVLIRKLEQFGKLSSSERQILENLHFDVQQVDAHQDLGQEGQQSLHCLPRLPVNSNKRPHARFDRRSLSPLRPFLCAPRNPCAAKRAQIHSPSINMDPDSLSVVVSPTLGWRRRSRREIRSTYRCRRTSLRRHSYTVD